MRAGNGSDREIRAQIKGEWYCIEPGKDIDVTPEVASILGEYGADISQADLQAANAEAADLARAQNSKTASANASTADIEARRAQVTTDVATGAVVDPNADVVTAPNADPIPGTSDGPATGDAPAAGELKGAELDQALKDRDLPTSGTADEKRARVAEFDKAKAELDQQAAGQAGGDAPNA